MIRTGVLGHAKGERYLFTPADPHGPLVSCGHGHDVQGEPLWCEYLPPWVLRKEFETVLAAFGVHYLCSPRFRLGLGPEAPDGTAAAGAGSSPSGQGSAARPADRTIFWNLILHFRELSLPIAFLLADEAFSGEGMMVMGRGLRGRWPCVGLCCEVFGA